MLKARTWPTRCGWPSQQADVRILIHPVADLVADRWSIKLNCPDLKLSWPTSLKSRAGITNRGTVDAVDRVVWRVSS